MPRHDPPPRGYLSVRDAAVYLGITERALRQRIARHQIPWRRWDRRIVLIQAEIDTYMAALPGCSVDQALDQMEEDWQCR